MHFQVANLGDMLAAMDSDPPEETLATQLEILQKSTFGKRTAEEESDQLQSYFVETEQWRRVFSGDIDIVYGPKGSGKSAIYSLITKNVDQLFDRGILVASGENPQGTVAFKDVAVDPPETEFEFISLWKLYMLTICGQKIVDLGLQGDKCNTLLEKLREADLLPSSGFTLSKVLKYATDYVKGLFRTPESVEGELKVDPTTGMPLGVGGKIVFREPDAKQARVGVVSIEELFTTANAAFAENKMTLWILLDRLDVAFPENSTIEASALRSLFKFYLDSKQLTNIKFKIFIRTDIWNNLLDSGFREASHIERSLGPVDECAHP